MLTKLSLVLGVLVLLIRCASSSAEKNIELQKDSIKPNLVIEKEAEDSLKLVNAIEVPINDTLNAVANIMSGITDSSSVYNFIQNSSDFKIFSKNFDKRWMAFDSSRLTNLRNFKVNEISKVVKAQSTLFYPFSGPDILYAQTFFPEADTNCIIPKLSTVNGFTEQNLLPVRFKNKNNKCNAPSTSLFFKSFFML
jgi:hypothetical protein